MADQRPPGWEDKLWNIARRNFEEAPLRRLFESLVFNKYFVSRVESTGQGGPFALWTKDGTQDMQTFIRRDENGYYVEEGLEPAWWGFREAARQMGDVTQLIEAAQRHGWPESYPWEKT